MYKCQPWTFTWFAKLLTLCPSDWAAIGHSGQIVLHSDAHRPKNTSSNKLTLWSLLCFWASQPLRNDSFHHQSLESMSLSCGRKACSSYRRPATPELHLSPDSTSNYVEIYSTSPPPHVSFLSFRTRESRDFKVRRLSFAAAVGDFFLCSQGYFDIMHYRHHLDWDHKQKIDKHASVWAIVCFHPAFTFAIKTFQIHSNRQTEMQMYVYLYLFPCDTVMRISEAERIKTAAINFSFMEVRFRCVFFRKLDMSWVLKNTNLLNKKKNHNYAMQICVCKNNLWLASHIHHGNYKGDTLHNEVIFPCIFYTPTTYMTFHWAPGLTCF